MADDANQLLLELRTLTQVGLRALAVGDVGYRHDCRGDRAVRISNRRGGHHEDTLGSISSSENGLLAIDVFSCAQRARYWPVLWLKRSPVKLGRFEAK